MYIYRSRHTGLSMRHDRQEPSEFTVFNLHTHATAELFYLISGGGVFHIEGSSYRLQPGDIVLMRPAEAHYIEQDPTLPYERICLNFDPKILSTLDPENTLLRPYYDREPGNRNHYRTAGTPDAVCRTYLDNILNAPDDRLKAVANLILLLRQVCVMFDREGAAPEEPDTLEYRIVRYINDNLQKDLSLQDLCDYFFISRAQLCRRFKKVTGTSVGKFVTAKRLLKAQHLICQGKKPTDVFAECGYQDYSTFYRAYLQHFGHSPRDARGLQTEEDDRVEIG